MNKRITKSENILESLKESEEKYRYIFIHNPQPMWIYDLETLAFLEVNEAAIHHYGYSRDEFMQMTIKDIRPATDIFLLFENIKDEPSSESPPGGWRHLKKNGEIIYVEIAASSVYFEGRKARHILINDITQRRLAEEKLLHISRLYAFLSHINQAIIQTKDQEELFNRICKIAIEHGQFRMAWIGMIDENSKRLQSVAMAGHDDGYLAQGDFSADNQPTGLGPVGTAAKEGKIIICSDVATDPRMIVWKDRALERGYHSLAAVPLRCRVKIIGTLTLYSKDSGFFTDDEQQLLQEIGDDISFALDAKLTEKENRLAQLEAQRLRQALDLITAHVYIKDLQSRYVYANKHSLGLFGCSPAELVGSDDYRFFPREVAKRLADIDQRVFKGEETSEEVDINDPSKGRRVYWEVKVPIFTNAEDKTICGLIGISTDITERKLTEEELIKSKEKAVESDRLKSAFLANMSHEVRTPLNSILGFTSLLVDPDFDEDQRKVFIHHIILNGNNLLNIINDIMDISKIESGEIKIQKQAVNACEFVTNIQQQFSLQAKEKNLELKLTIPSTKETIVYADRDRLNQVIINLISNALKFTKEGYIEIGYLPKGNQVLFFVIDTGIGIPAEYHQKIFERFRQVEMEDTRKYGGNGLGLAITKNLVELMDGHIWLQSEPGKGSVFYFTLPVFRNQ